jgi:tetratricopeptide (TPR) repeat protein
MRLYEQAEVKIRRAIEIAPDRPDAYYYAVLNDLLRDGDTDNARRVLAGLPTFDDPRLHYMSVLLDFYDRDFEALLEGVGELPDDGIEFAEVYLPKELVRCIAFDTAGNHDQALPACELSVSALRAELDRRPHDYRLYSALGHANAILGNVDDAVAAGRRAAEMFPVEMDFMEGPYPAIDLAKILARVGDHDGAIDQLELLLSIPCRLSVPLLRLDPAWDPLRDHPRFRQLVEN